MLFLVISLPEAWSLGGVLFRFERAKLMLFDRSRAWCHPVHIGADGYIGFHSRRPTRRVLAASISPQGVFNRLELQKAIDTPVYL